MAIVVPHAGYVFSGQIAADAYKQVAGMAVDTVVILGTNHTSGTFRRISVFDGAGYRTPLGVAAVDRPLAEALVTEGGGTFDATLHEREHSVEVQVPFVQVIFPKAKIVPVVVGSADRAQAARFARALAGLAKDRHLLVVASSDLSHYPRAARRRRHRSGDADGDRRLRSVRRSMTRRRGRPAAVWAGSRPARAASRRFSSPWRPRVRSAPRAAPS